MKNVNVAIVHVLVILMSVTHFNPNTSSDVINAGFESGQHVPC